MVQKALERDIFSQNERAAAEDGLKGNTENLVSAYELARQFFVREEHQFRDEALKDYGLEDAVKSSPDQTIVRPDTAFVLGMARSNQDAIAGIYAEAGYLPEAQMIGAVPYSKEGHLVLLGGVASYGLNQEEVEVSNRAFCGTRDEYRETFSQIMDIVPKTIDRFLEEAA